MIAIILMFFMIFMLMGTFMMFQDQIWDLLGLGQDDTPDSPSTQGTECKTSFDCGNLGSCVSGQCVRVTERGRGEPCDNQANVCESGLLCDEEGGVCRSIQGKGCDIDSDCHTCRLDEFGMPVDVNCHDVMICDKPDHVCRISPELVEERAKCDPACSHPYICRAGKCTDPLDILDQPDREILPHDIAMFHDEPTKQEWEPVLNRKKDVWGDGKDESSHDWLVRIFRAITAGKIHYLAINPHYLFADNDVYTNSEGQEVRKRWSTVLPEGQDRLDAGTLQDIIDYTCSSYGAGQGDRMKIAELVDCAERKAINMPTTKEDDTEPDLAPPPVDPLLAVYRQLGYKFDETDGCPCGDYTPKSEAAGYELRPVVARDLYNEGAYGASSAQNAGFYYPDGKHIHAKELEAKYSSSCINFLKNNDLCLQ